MFQNPAKYLLILLIPAVLVFLFIHKDDNICANSISCIKDLSVNIENNATGTYNGRKITPPKIDLTADAQIKKRVLGDSSTNGGKHIYIDLTNQTLYAYQGDSLFMQTLVSTGKWAPTPTGDFKIWIRLRATRMTGGQGADYYNLPNVPYVMYFASDQVPAYRGFSLHGTYWHNNFGHPMSHGCVNMRTVDAEKIYYWIDDPEANQTLVTIYGQAPL